MDYGYEAQREEMVARLRVSGIRDERVLHAMARVPRHLFVPESERAFAYEDRALAIGYSQTISQPYIVARILEALELDGSERALDVGTGSAYQAALLGLLAREVFSVEIVQPLEENARRLLDTLGFENVHVVHANGSLGWKHAAPYEAIACAAGAPEVPPDLTEQLKDGGRLVIPVGPRNVQRLVLAQRHHEEIETADLGGVVFVPLVGAAGWPTIAA